MSNTINSKKSEIKPTEEKQTKKPDTIQEAKLAIQNEFGSGAILFLDENPTIAIDVIPSRIPQLDKALGVGGFPKGRIIELFGPESSGKTSLCLHIIKEAQQNGRNAALIDVEHAIDLAWARQLGVNPQTLLFAQPDSGEQALQMLYALVSYNLLDVIVLDSVAALVPQAELDGTIGTEPTWLQAQMMSTALRKLTNIITNTNTVVIFTNQTRQQNNQYGNTETTPGGKALKFYATIRLRMQKGETIANINNEKIGTVIKFKVVKNKIAPPLLECQCNILFGNNNQKPGFVF